ncbi:adenylate kinase family protein [Candidatus Nesciobacter abundans]|uniref:Adenylate kinase n=1 Tax=Candidatus Nesciobacter abundans TaxID=2601668 RepID=A0A5C0UGY0_9PROT|nr:nucleoside monophosphate kinase [Candidatus Nesciobacter abundans]QEK38921.1 AAA family ATPase [Candidatus Nesciobacter abundans]
MKRIAFIGPPGSGKGTQSEIISDLFDINVFSIGLALRREIEKKTDLGFKAQEYISKGELVPMDILKCFFKDFFKENEEFIVDGLPRTVDQAKFLQTFFKNNMPLEMVIEFVVPEESVVGRLSKRIVCSKCGSLISCVNEKICSECGSVEFEKRQDDLSEQAIRKRISIFGEEIKEIREFYKKSGVFYSFDASGDVLEIKSRLIELIQKNT